MGFAENPHHVHKEVKCNMHPDTCSEDHWIGGMPEPTHPHRVHVDLSTGLVGYVRLNKQEVKDLKLREKEAAKAFEDAQVKREAEIAQLKSRAITDPDFALLLKHLKIGD